MPKIKRLSDEEILKIDFYDFVGAEELFMDDSEKIEYYRANIENAKKPRKEKIKTQSTAEGFMMSNGKAGDVFYTEKEDKAMTAMANYHKRKILTERLVVVKPTYSNPEVKPILKVTLQ